MSDEGRRVFKMEAVYSLLSGQSNADVSEMLGYLAQRSLDEDTEAAVAPMAKAWLFSLNPDFLKVCCCEGGAHSESCAKTRSELPDNISISPIPASHMNELNALLDKVEAAMSESVADQAAAAAANKKAKELEPFKKKAEDLDKKVAQLEEKVKSLDAANNELKAEAAKFTGKVAIDEDALESSVKDIVSRAVKASLGALAVAGAGAAAGAEGAAAAEPAAEESASGGVPDTFGFGASGASDDGFGF